MNRSALAAAAALLLSACGAELGSEPDTTSAQLEVVAEGLNYPSSVHFVETALGGLEAGTLVVAQAGTTGAGANSIVAIPPSGAPRRIADGATTASGNRRVVDRPEDVDAGGPFVAVANFSGGLGSVGWLDPGGVPLGAALGGGVLDARDFGFTVTRSVPAAGAQVGAGSVVVQIFFSQPLNPDSVQEGRVFLDRVGSSDDPEVRVELAPDARSITMTPLRGLMAQTAYRIRVRTSLRDVFGNGLDADPFTPKRQEFNAEFRVGGQIRELTVTSISPADRETGVPLTSSVTAQFSTQVVPTTVNEQTFFVTGSAGRRIAGTLQVANDRFSATFTPSGSYEADTVHTVTLTTDIRDNLGNQLDANPGGQPQPFESTFTTAGGVDTTGPRVTQVDPPDGGQAPTSAIVTVTFNEPVDPASVTSSSFRLERGGSTVAGTVSTAGDNRQAVFRPSAALQGGQTYTVIVTTDVRDRSGNQLDQVSGGGPDPFRSTFSVASASAVINEVVTDPQRDWNDTQGGDGNPFNGTPGSGSATDSDEWIEIFNAGSQALDVRGWTLEMRDTTSETHVIGSPPSSSFEVYSAGSSASSLRPGGFLVIGNPNGEINNDIYLVLRNAGGTAVDDVEIGDDPESDGNNDGAPDPGADGNATSAGDEAVGRRPNGRDTNNDVDDFTKLRATIGAGNNPPPAVIGVSLPGLDGGVTGIAYGGPAPDEAGPLSHLYFIASSNNELILAADLDDTAYPLTLFTNPRAIAFAPGETAGSGELFVLHASDARIGSGGATIGSGFTRLRIEPTGAVGSPGTLVQLGAPETGAVVALVSTLFNQPVGLTYDTETDRLYVANRGDGSVLEIDAVGTPEILRVLQTDIGPERFTAIEIGTRGGRKGLFLADGGSAGLDGGPQGRLVFLTLP